MGSPVCGVHLLAFIYCRWARYAVPARLTVAAAHRRALLHAPSLRLWRGTLTSALRTSLALFPAGALFTLVLLLACASCVACSEEPQRLGVALVLGRASLRREILWGCCCPRVVGVLSACWALLVQEVYFVAIPP